MHAYVFLDDRVHVPVPKGQGKVQGHAADELIDGETYAPVACTACENLANRGPGGYLKNSTSARCDGRPFFFAYIKENIRGRIPLW